ncbi:ABC transporter permease [Clostridium butyricum]|uniref:ABC transporter permease n=1 Tax=Clostridium butyricum TaxID=1492 RepID=UPI001FAD64B6|nr:ABC transporter permease [Clostridium butyricum]MCQ2019467.1 ABC transporter permease [Clostridium butyricum]MCQ2021539.1 ABC transporter permease [Clostridium butyricum]
MMNYFKLGVKKLLSILKEESSRLIGVIVSPLITLFLLSYVWSNVYVENIPFGIVDLDNTSLSRTVIEQLSNCASLKVDHFFDSESDLEQAIKERTVHGGIIIPQNFSKDVSMKKSPKAEIIVDGTNMLIGGNALSGAASVMGTLSAGTELKMLQGNGMFPSVAKTAIGTFSYVQRILYDPQGSYIRNMSYTVVPLVIQMAFLCEFFIPMFIKKKKDFATMKIRSKEFIFSLLDIIIRIALFALVVIIATFIGLCLIKRFYSLPMRGELWIYAVLMIAFFFNLIGFGLVFASILSKMDYFVFVYTVCSTPFMMTCGVAYPFYMMPAGVEFFIKFISPLAQVAVPLKNLNLKGVGWDIILPYFKESIGYSLFWIPIGLIMYIISVIITKYKITKSSEYIDSEDNMNIQTIQ